MRLSEISNEQKTFLTLSGIEYNFVNDYKLVMSAYSIVGKSTHRRSMLAGDIDKIISRMSPVLNYGFAINDPDILAINDIYTKLSNIRNTL